MIKLNGKDISDLFEITCKKCGNKDVDIIGYSRDGYGYGAVDCKNCNNSADEIE